MRVLYLFCCFIYFSLMCGELQMVHAGVVSILLSFVVCIYSTLLCGCRLQGASCVCFVSVSLFLLLLFCPSKGTCDVNRVYDCLGAQGLSQT